MEINQKLSKTPDVSIKETILWLWKFWGNLRGAVYFLVIATPLTMFLRAYPPILISKIVNELSKTDTSYIAVNNIAFEVMFNPYSINPQYLDNNFDLLISGVANASNVKENIFFFLLLGVLNLFCYIFVQAFRAIMNYNLENAFRLSVFNYIIKLGQSFFQKFETGDLTTRLIDDVSEKKLAWFACSGIFRTYEGVLSVLISLYFMSALSIELTIVSFIPLVSILTMYIFVSRKTTEYSKRTQEAVSKLNSFLTSTFDGIKIVKSYAQEKNQEKYFDSVVENQRNKEIELVKVSSLLELTYTRIAEAIIIFVFMFGGWLVINNKIQLGTVIAFNSYIFMLIWPMVDIGQFFLKGRTASVSVGRIKELENFEPDIVNKEKPLSLQGKKLNWGFKNISYVFPNGNKVIKDISFEAKQGQIIAIAGGTGCGKSTFINVIPRIIDPENGEVLLDNINLKEYDVFELRKHIGFVPQTPSLFSDTIRENILFGRNNISEDALKKAIKVAQLESEIESFTDKLETLIGQRGVTLSGGQKQRVAIARAIVEKPEILILDDCTSALDAETESKLWNELYEFIPGITVFLITHRVSTLQKADKIILLQNGEVSAQGTHDQLSKTSEEYVRIYLSHNEE